MPRNDYDQASRYAVKLDPVGFLGWALDLSADGFVFREWLDTRGIPFPGDFDRTGDTVAHLADPTTNLVPWAVALEFQAEPDPVMFGRLLVYLGHLWLSLKPDPGRGSRFRLGAVVVNLTGTGYATRRMQWLAAGLETTIAVRERNMEDESADDALTGIASGRWSRGLLPWIPLMTGGADAGIIDRWKALADGEPDARRRAEYGGLAQVLANAAGRAAIWKNALRDWNMRQSEVVMEWRQEGQTQGQMEALFAILAKRFGSVPEELKAAIHDAATLPTLKAWIEAALDAATLDEFRTSAGI